MSEIFDQARAFQAEDPDPATRAELETVLARAQAGDASALADLRDRFASGLAFGTAGLRGRVEAGLAPFLDAFGRSRPDQTVLLPSGPIAAAALPRVAATEIGIHRWDLESVLDDHRPIAADLAADILDDVFGRWIRRLDGSGPVPPLGGAVALHATDTADHWMIDVLDGRVVAAHAVWLDDDDMARLGDHGASVAHNPGSNMRLGGGLAAIVDLAGDDRYEMDGPALGAAVAGGAPSCISVFAGRIADTGYDPVPLMSAAVELLKVAPSAELIWASPRELLNIFQADAIGCHIITVTNDILKKLSNVGRDLEDYSLDTVKMFHTDAAQAGFTL